MQSGSRLNKIMPNVRYGRERSVTLAGLRRFTDARTEANFTLTTTMARQSKPKLSDFEKSLNELEKIVERMERGDQSLEASLKDFERGISLSRACRASLDEAEQRIEKLVEKNGTLETEVLNLDD